MASGAEGSCMGEVNCLQVLRSWIAGYGSFPLYYCFTKVITMAKDTQTVFRLWYRRTMSWRSSSRFFNCISKKRSGRRLGHNRWLQLQDASRVYIAEMETAENIKLISQWMVTSWRPPILRFPWQIVCFLSSLYAYFLLFGLERLCLRTDVRAYGGVARNFRSSRCPILDGCWVRGTLHIHPTINYHTPLCRFGIVRVEQFWKWGCDWELLRFHGIW